MGRVKELWEDRVNEVVDKRRKGEINELEAFDELHSLGCGDCADELMEVCDEQ